VEQTAAFTIGDTTEGIEAVCRKMAGGDKAACMKKLNRCTNTAKNTNGIMKCFLDNREKDEDEQQGFDQELASYCNKYRLGPDKDLCNYERKQCSTRHSSSEDALTCTKHVVNIPNEKERADLTIMIIDEVRDESDEFWRLEQQCDDVDKDLRHVCHQQKDACKWIHPNDPDNALLCLKENSQLATHGSNGDGSDVDEEEEKYIKCVQMHCKQPKNNLERSCTNHPNDPSKVICPWYCDSNQVTKGLCTYDSDCTSCGQMSFDKPKDAM
jgi:hypothetical protein